jgi:outer membrane protein assembly factor BamB
MSRSNSFRYIILITLLLISSCICLCGGVVIWFYTTQYLLPIQPRPQGAFPTIPSWTFNADGRILSTPVISDSIAILRTPNRIVALDLIEKQKIWETESSIPSGINTDDLTLSPLVANNWVVVSEKGSNLVAYSILTGNRVWRSQPIQSEPSNLHFYQIEDYAINQNEVYVARSNWSLSAYALQNGELLWEVDVPNRSVLNVDADDKCVYLGANESLTCYDPETGELLWDQELPALIGRMSLDENTMYILMPFGHASLGALDLDNLKWIWLIDKTKFPEDELRTITVTDDYIYIGGEARLYKISKKDGEIVWKSDEIGWLETPVLINSNVIVRNTAKDLYVFDANTGEQTGNLMVKRNTAMKRDPERSPAVYKDLLLVPFGDNRIFVYKLK